jgi:hypothetical protein
MKVNVFKLWMQRMGFHGRQVMEACVAIGVDGRRTGSKIHNGQRELTETELLAMSAVTAGLKPWSPAYHDELVALREVQALIDQRVAALAATHQAKTASAKPVRLDA